MGELVLFARSPRLSNVLILQNYAHNTGTCAHNTHEQSKHTSACSVLLGVYKILELPLPLKLRFTQYDTHTYESPTLTHSPRHTRHTHAHTTRYGWHASMEHKLTAAYPLPPRLLPNTSTHCKQDTSGTHLQSKFLELLTRTSHLSALFVYPKVLSSSSLSLSLARAFSLLSLSLSLSLLSYLSLSPPPSLSFLLSCVYDTRASFASSSSPAIFLLSCVTHICSSMRTLQEMRRTQNMHIYMCLTIYVSDTTVYYRRRAYASRLRLRNKLYRCQPPPSAPPSRAPLALLPSTITR